jgi:hypothetical protein
MEALAVVCVQGPRGLIPTQQIILRRLRATAEAGAGEADTYQVLRLDDAKFPVNLAAGRRQIRCAQCPAASELTQSTATLRLGVGSAQGRRSK